VKFAFRSQAGNVNIAFLIIRLDSRDQEGDRESQNDRPRVPAKFEIKRKSSKPDNRSGQSTGGFMAEETAEQRLARLEAENKALRDQIEQRKPGQLRLKVSEKGGLSVYGLGRFPVTLYKEQWVRLLDHGEEIKKFLHENDQQLKAKQ
jgi:hypothetical protein